MGWGTSFLVYLEVIFVSNKCFQDHRIIKSVMDRPVSIFCILATSGITSLVSIVSQIKDIVLFNTFKTKRKCWKGFFYKILPILLLKWSNRATGDMPN